MRITRRCPPNTICPVKIQMCSIHRAHQWDPPESYLKATLGLEHNRQTCLVHKQGECASHATTTVTTRQQQACGTNREKTNKDAATRQQAGMNNLVNLGSTDKLGYTSRFVRVIGEVREDEVEELVGRPGTTKGTWLAVLQLIFQPFFDGLWFFFF